MNPRNTPLTLEEKETIRRVYLEVGNQHKVAIITGHSNTTVGKVLKDYGLNKKQGGNQVAQMKITDEQLVEAVQKMTTKQIAEKYSIHETNVLRRCKKLGIKPVTAPKDMSGLKRYWGQRNENLRNFACFGECWHFISSFNETCNKKHPDFQYMESRRIGTTIRVRLKCKACGTIVERNQSTVLQKNIRCECCKEQNKLRDERVKLMRFFIALKDAKTPKICACCGEEFYSVYPTTVYCSEQCRKRAKLNRTGNTKNYRHRARKYGCSYESGITRIAVVRRDKNTCQICGKICNPNDKRWGTFGPDYPTLDHKIPLAKGGPHSWSNVQCACGECNSIKRDLLIV